MEAERFISGVCTSLSKSTAKQPRTTPEEQAAKHGLDVEQADMIDGGGSCVSCGREQAGLPGRLLAGSKSAHVLRMAPLVSGAQSCDDAAR